ncbi:MAG: tRNA (adenosine(37)-N6)-dimethylallyltransferase MiaA [Alphaproteobacteria bacterium]|nr:tRNA (adenosine(37)-N6)-dimethylallyltransferase MiaA [Alphaproteobacteria bacterium]
MSTDHHHNAERPPVVVIAGPTASGKSALAVTLAQRMKGEVVNADSMQVYRDLPVLTAIPDHDERQGVAHHGYGVLDGAERCSVGRWMELTRGYIEEIWRRGGVPILVGGTGMYIRAALEGISPMPDIDPKFRDQATAMLAAMGGAGFRAELMARDPVLAARLNDGDSQRLIRGMEIVLATGTPLSAWQDKPPQGAIAADFTTIRIAPPREELYARIDQRFPMMLKAGGVEEARALMARALDPSLPLMKAVGFPPIADYLRGATSRDDAVELACRDSRRYAKRQTTWFNNQFAANFCEDSSYNAQYSESFIDKILSKVIL